MDKGRGRQGRLQAYEAIKRMERPESITPTNWNRVKQLLWIIARRYPKAYPGQETLAKEMDLSVRTVQRLVRMAKDAKLLTVWADAGLKSRANSISKTNWYHITELLEHDDKMTSSNDDRMTFKETGGPKVPPVQQTAPSVQKTSSSAPLGGAPSSGRTTLPGMVPKAEKERTEALLPPERYIEGRSRSKDPDLARRVAGYFLDQWNDKVVFHYPGLRERRAMESLRQTMSYLNATFFYPPGGRQYTEDEVRGLIDEFMEALYRSTANLKPTQSAFMCFCGWWGRDRSPDMPTDDARRYHEEALTKQKPSA